MMEPEFRRRGWGTVTGRRRFLTERYVDYRPAVKERVMRERVKPMKEPRKPHGDMIQPNDPTEGSEAERQREQQRKDKPRASGANSPWKKD
jgi:hypothetical protein